MTTHDYEENELLTWKFMRSLCRMFSYSDHITRVFEIYTPSIPVVLKTYAAISNAHLSHVCKRGKLSGSCLSTLNGFGSTQLPILFCHIGVPTFSQNN